ncbi:MAG: efflux RND transporter periplasmic adaptor subunit [Phycisphaeraceae bacterium]|nr:efflux RND transporter periplasmic adaptor subunit [Phycisphaeraceae bacterium]
MKRSSLLAGVAVFAGIGLVGGGLALVKYREFKKAAAESHAFEPAQAVQVVEAKEVQWRPTAELIGTVISLRSVRVSNELAGSIKEVRFESGSVVEAGQVLLVLDDSADQADLAAAKANVRVAEASVSVADARLSLAKSELERMEGAVKARAASEMDYDRSKSELQRAEADRDRLVAEIDQAKARVAQVQTRLDKMVIKAPFKGRAGLRLVHEGQYLAEGSSIVLLESMSDTIYLDFAVPQEYLARVHPGLAVMATSDVLGPEPVRIEVVAVDATVNNDTRNVRVRAVVHNEDERLRPGMFIKIRVPVEETRAYVAVPTTAVRRTSYGDQVFVVKAVPAPEGAAPGGGPGEQLRASQRFVRLGPMVGDDVIVLEGLSVGDPVAATGSFKLHEGALVSRVEPGTAAAGGAPVASKESAQP